MWIERDKNCTISIHNKDLKYCIIPLDLHKKGNGKEIYIWNLADIMYLRNEAYFYSEEYVTISLHFYCGQIL